MIKRKGITLVEFITILGIILLIIVIPISYWVVGIGGFGPVKVITATIATKHVDHKGESSNYMVTTDAGVFEVDNGVMLGVWNSDEIYGAIKEGKKYKFTIQGNKVVGMFFQEYPYIIKYEEITETKIEK